MLSRSNRLLSIHSLLFIIAEKSQCELRDVTALCARLLKMALRLRDVTVYSSALREADSDGNLAPGPAVASRQVEKTERFKQISRTAFTSTTAIPRRHCASDNSASNASQ
jgi:hypothetical protein